MQGLLKQGWWAFLIGGIALVVFGVLALVWPMETLLVLALFFAASILIDGVFTVVGALARSGSCKQLVAVAAARHPRRRCRRNRPSRSRRRSGCDGLVASGVRNRRPVS